MELVYSSTFSCYLVNRILFTITGFSFTFAQYVLPAGQGEIETSFPHNNLTVEISSFWVTS